MVFCFFLFFCMQLYSFARFNLFVVTVYFNFLFVVVVVAVLLTDGFDFQISRLEKSLSLSRSY